MEVNWLHLPVVVLRVTLGKITPPQVFSAWYPENMETLLFGFFLSRIEAHIQGFWMFFAHWIV